MTFATLLFTGTEDLTAISFIHNPKNLPKHNAKLHLSYAFSMLRSSTKYGTPPKVHSYVCEHVNGSHDHPQMADQPLDGHACAAAIK